MAAVAAANTSSGTSSRTPTATFTGYVPVAGDVVIIFAVTGDSGVPANTPPAGWVTLTQTAASGCALSALYHVVDSVEAGAATTTYSATNYFDLSKNWRSVAAVVRGGDPVSPIDAFGAVNGASVTPHPTAALVGGDVVSGSLILAAVSSGGDRTYAGAPAGWSMVVSNSTGTGIGLWVRSATTSAGVNVDSVNVSPSAAATYASISAAFTMASPGSNSGAFFGFL